MKKLLLILSVFAISACSGGAGENNNSKTDQRDGPSPAATAAPQTTAQAPTSARAVLTLSVGSKGAKTGAEVCVDITVADFQNILSMQYSLQWDKEVLQFQRVQGFALPFLGPQNFGAHRVEEGILTFVWIENNLQGANKTDGSSIYQLCFRVKGGQGQSSAVSFTETPTPFEVVNTKEEVLPLNGQAGMISVQ